ncbi:Uracil-DNA glycosylase, family 4 [hydrothermal vent metagenome]|uniref:Type-4 uracil-DNA glycosylase n=1 Tax=hydrothermal vent metagenome TaxID=652676 RepID=A0A3B1B5I3_9ZZZZ
MTNLTSKQQEYLSAMGIDVWLPKDAAPEETQTAGWVEQSAKSGRETHHHQEEIKSISSTEEDVPVGVEPDETLRQESPQREPRQDNDISTLDWEALQTRVAECRLCELHKTRTQTVFGVGKRNADWLIIGEAPGADEDRQGEPFVGRAGQLLNAMLQALDLQREDVYIANILKCRPPQNRDPKAEEVLHCSPWLERQIQLIQPKVILALGRIAAQKLLQTNTSLGRLRGRLHHIESTAAPVIVTYHPAYLLRSPLEKRKSWEDLLFAKKTLEAGDS